MVSAEGHCQPGEILRFIDETKRDACRNYGWSFTLFDSEDDESDYPFIHLKIYWPESADDKVISRVNEEFFWDSDVKYEDLAIFTNNYNAGDCHSAVCSLMENNGIAEWLLSEGIGKVHTDDDDDFNALKESGLELEHIGGYSCIGRVQNESDEEVKIKIKDDGYFIPNKVREIDSKRFMDWYGEQERYEILECDSEDFWYYRDSAIETIRKYRSNPELFLGDYPVLKDIFKVAI